MISTLLALAGLAGAQDGATASYDCLQTNPMQYADFHLRFRAALDPDPDRPYSAVLYDNESGDVRIFSDTLRRNRAYWIEGFHPYTLGYDDVGTGYVLRVPSHGDLSGSFVAQVVQVFGGGQAQWVNEFTCVVD